MTDQIICRCNLRTKLLGDGCAVCNPTLMNGLTEAETAATASCAGLSAGAVPELPVVGWTIPSFALWVSDAIKCLGQAPGCDVPVTPHAPAQATIVAQAAEIERLKREFAAALYSGKLKP